MSAITSGRHPKPKGKIKVGICENHKYTDPNTGKTGDCPKCASGEHIKIDSPRRSDFRCPECGAMLKEVKQRKWIVWGIIACVAAAIAGICYCMMPKGSASGDGGDTVDSSEVVIVDSTVDTVVDSLKVEDSTKVKPDTVKHKGEDPIIPPGPVTVLNGAAEILTDQKGNKYLKFKKEYVIDLKTFNDDKIQVGSGYELKNIKIDNNCVTSGDLYFDGKRKERLTGIRIAL